MGASVLILTSRILIRLHYFTPLEGPRHYVSTTHSIATHSTWTDAAVLIYIDIFNNLSGIANIHPMILITHTHDTPHQYHWSWY
jgi:hypothetical protein